MSRCVSRFWPFVLCLLAFGARADIVTDWADTTTQIADDGPNTIRTMALAQNAVYEAVNAITARYPRDRVDLGPTQGASVEAAVAAASRAVLLQEAPGLKEKIEAAYARALARIGAGEARTNGIGVGERAAADVLTKHGHDLDSIEPYRPAAAPGLYVPTTIPTGWSLGMHRPWFMKSAAQFRPGPPPTLKRACSGHGITTRSRLSAPRRVRYARPSRPRSPSSGRPHCPTFTSASRAPSRPAPTGR